MNTIQDDAEVHVAYCVDAGFVVPLAVSLASLSASSGSRRVDVHVLSTRLDDRARAQIDNATDGLRVHWYDVDEQELEGLHSTDFLTNATLLRLLLGDVLPRHVSRVIYVDADTVVADDVFSLYLSDLGGRSLGAVRDATSPWAAGVFGADWPRLDLDPSSAYFNAGVLLIDLDEWRRAEEGERCLDLLRRVNARWGDQDALNKVFEGRWHALPRRWNVQTADHKRDSVAWALWRAEIESAIRNPGIIHYTTRDKPWTPGSTHPESRRWLDFLDTTAWAGWRPTDPRRTRNRPTSLVVRAADRGLRWWRAREARLPC